ncbi:hypothetical protein U1Q18_027570 [Sarracenia purpurea var. burkii]
MSLSLLRAPHTRHTRATEDRSFFFFANKHAVSVRRTWYSPVLHSDCWNYRRRESSEGCADPPPRSKIKTFFLPTTSLAACNKLRRHPNP